jgi:hypothetical protein
MDCVEASVTVAIRCVEISHQQYEKVEKENST